MDKTRKDKKNKKDKKKINPIEEIKFRGIHNCKYHHCGIFEIGVCENEKIYVCPDTHRKVLKTYFNNYENCSFTPVDDLDDEDEDEEGDESDTSENSDTDEEEGFEEEEEFDETEFAIIFKDFPDLMIVFSDEYVPGLKSDLTSCSFLEQKTFEKRIDGRIFIDETFMESKLKSDEPNFYALLKALREKIKTKTLGSMSELFPLFEKCLKLKKDEKKPDKKQKNRKSKDTDSESESDNDEEDDDFATHSFQISVYNGKDCEKADKKQIATWCPRTWDELKELDYQLDYVGGDKVIDEPELNLKISFPLLRPKIIKITAINGKSFTVEEILNNISKEYMKIYDEQGTSYRNADKFVDYTELIDARYRRLYQKALSLWKKLLKEKYGIKTNIPNVKYEFDQDDEEETQEGKTEKDSSKSGKTEKGQKEEETEGNGEEEEYDEYDEPEDIDFFQSIGEDPIFLFYRPDSLDYSCLEYNTKTKTICPVLDIDKINFMECQDFYELRDLLFDVAFEFNPNGRHDDP